MASILLSSYKVVKTYVGNRYDFNKEVYDYIEANNDKLFVIGCPGVKISANYNSPLSLPEQPSNILMQSGWGVGAQHYNEIKNEYGIENTYTDIIDNDKVYFVDITNDIDMLKKYFNDFYSSENHKIQFIEIQRFDNISVYSLVTE